MARIDPQADLGSVTGSVYPLSILAPLVQGVKEDMVRIADYPFHLGGGIGRRVGVYLPSELLASHPGLDGPAGADPVEGFGD